MGVVTVNGEDRLAVFGGYNGRNRIESVELYDALTGKWETPTIRVPKARDSQGKNLGFLSCAFGFLTIKLGELVSKL